MSIESEIQSYIDSLPEPKRSEMQSLHTRMLARVPGIQLWYSDGRDETGKVVANPNIGYGFQLLKYANGKTKEWFRVGISGNTTGISVYLLGIEDRAFLKNTYGSTIGKASVTGYCIKFKSVKDINLEVLDAAIGYTLEL